MMHLFCPDYTFIFTLKDAILQNNDTYNDLNTPDEHAYLFNSVYFKCN